MFTVDVAFGLLHVYRLVDITGEKRNREVELPQFKIFGRRNREEQTRGVVASYRRECVAIINPLALMKSPYN